MSLRLYNKTDLDCANLAQELPTNHAGANSLTGAAIVQVSRAVLIYESTVCAQFDVEINRGLSTMSRTSSRLTRFKDADQNLAGIWGERSGRHTQAPSSATLLES